MQVPFLSLMDVTNMHGEEIREVARRVIDSGWYLQGREDELIEQHYADYIATYFGITENGLIPVLIKYFNEGSPLRSLYFAFY